MVTTKIWDLVTASAILPSFQLKWLFFVDIIKVSSAQYFTLHYKYDECAYDCANQPLVMFRSQNMKFSFSFSHFQPF